jgi:S-adenosylmethionine:tRNA ribosyltransferase-isomerase
MKLSDFDYNLPKKLIAKNPYKPRDHSRLLILNKKTGEINHKKFLNIIDYFNKGDVIVLNNSKVFPARLIGKKKDSGGKVEVFLTSTPVSLIKKKEKKKIDYSICECLIRGSGVRSGLIIEFNKKLKCEIIKDNKDGTWTVNFSQNAKEMMRLIEKIGEVPLPPYIKKQRDASKGLKNKNDKKNYQTVYADSKKIGSVAAPTAGFHFTKSVLSKLKNKGVKIEYITLHVGLGTFASVKVKNIKKHKMHSEWVEVKKGVIKNILKAKKIGKKVVAVGTTSARSLEFVFGNKEIYLKQKDFSGFVDIFIYPGYRFKAVDALITNFHLPKSTLIMLVSALAGSKNIKKAYKIAIEEKYRFYSYGDAMFIL